MIKICFFRSSQRDKMKWFVYDINSQKETELGAPYQRIYIFQRMGKK